MTMKHMYTVQPYHVEHEGTIAIISPAGIVKKYEIDKWTIFTLKGDDKTNSATLHSLHYLRES